MMNRSLTRLAAILAAGAVAGMGLSACSSDKSGDAKSSEPKAGEVVHIDYWHRLPDKDGMIKVSDAVAEWNKSHPDIQVKATKFEGDADKSYEKISAAVKAGNAPCLAQAAYDGIPAMLVRGELMDVTKDAEQYKNNYAAGPWGQVSPGGKTYGIPQDTGPLVYYYNKAEFEKLGLKAPTTWDEYWTTAKDAAAKGKFASYLPKDDFADWFSGVEASHKGTWFGLDGDSWKVNIDSADSAKIGEEWQKSVADKTTLVADRWADAGGFNDAIKDGKLIGYLGAAWEVAFNLDSLGKDAKADWHVAQVPGDMTGPWGGSGIVVLKGCKYPKQALEFANWYNTNMKAMVSQGLVPAAKGTVETPNNIKALYGGQDVMAEMQKAAERANPNWLYSPTWPAVKKTLNDNMAASKPIPDNLKAAQAEAVKTLEALGLKVAK